MHPRQIICNHILCPLGQYWVASSLACVAKPGVAQAQEVPVAAASLPSVIRGCTLWCTAHDGRPCILTHISPPYAHLISL